MKSLQIMRQNTQYVRIKNNHIFIQGDGGTWLDHRDEILSKSNQRIHIFEICPLPVLSLFECIINDCPSSHKVIIHIPRFIKDWAAVINHHIHINLNDSECCKAKWKVITERTATKFVYYEDDMRKSFVVSFDLDNRNLFIHSHIEHLTYMIQRAHYKRPGGLRAIMTEPQRKYPYLFKDTIIKQFKRSSPKGILESFTNDEDIWGFILDEFDLKVSEDEKQYDEDESDDE